MLTKLDIFLASKLPKRGCWRWPYASSRDGYARIRQAGRTVELARVMYERHVGPVPPGHEPDHTCRVRACINPAHLEVVTKRENILRGTGAGARNARKSMCIHGHRLAGANLHTINRRGGIERICRTCRTERARRARAR